MINGEYTASMVLSRCRQTATGLLRWLVRIDQTFVPDITILVRMDATNQQPADYYLLPIMDIADAQGCCCARPTAISWTPTNLTRSTISPTWPSVERLRWRHERRQDDVQMIPIDKITVLNHRKRGKKKFKQIIANIAQIGLKKPITVAEYRTATAKRGIFSAVGGPNGSLPKPRQTEIPAIVIEATKEELMLISLVENLARRQQTTIEQARRLPTMRDRGDSLPKSPARQDWTSPTSTGF